MKEYMRMCLESALMVDEVKEAKSNVLVIVLLKIPSFSKHMHDLKVQRLTKRDVLCLTETQVLATLTTVTVSEFPEFNISHNSSYDRFQSIATCLRQSSVHLVCHETMTGTSYVEYVKSSFSNRVIKMLVIYKKRAISLTQFSDWVGEFVRTRHVDIILGDFNINVLGKSNAALSSALTNFIQIAKEPTHLSGSLKDHIYIHQDLLGNVNVEVKNFDQYLRHYDATQISLTDKSNN